MDQMMMTRRMRKMSSIPPPIVALDLPAVDIPFKERVQLLFTGRSPTVNRGLEYSFFRGIEYSRDMRLITRRKYDAAYRTRKAAAQALESQGVDANEELV
jgi:hypothetical protein